MNNELILTIIGAAGGTGAIVVALVKWFGSVWANSITESVKSSYARDLERLRDELEYQREIQLRNSGAQFDLYHNLWNNLQDLKLRGELLWKVASESNLRAFIEVLETTKMAVNKGRLILTDNHFHKLIEAIDDFDNYQLGKGSLINYRNNESLYGTLGGEVSYEEWQIEQNKTYKQKYEILLDDILMNFKYQLNLVA